MVDPLSDVLTAFDTRASLKGGVVGGGDWAIRFPAPGAIKFGAVVQGECWLAIDGCRPVRLLFGDVFVVNGRSALRLSSDPSIDPVDAADSFAAASGPIAHVGEGETFQLLGGHVQLDPAGIELLGEVLPPVVHVHAASPQAGTLAWLLGRLVGEALDNRPGAGAIIASLAQLLVIHVLRDHIEDEQLAPGWLKVAGDRRLAPTLRLIHAEPGRSWRLEELAQVASMSRSAFAEHFKAVSGMAPLTYLTNWRMRLAQRALREGGTSLASLSSSLGYGSESAFSTAFKRVHGMSPQHYRVLVRGKR